MKLLRWCSKVILFSTVLCEIATPIWQQYYPATHSWATISEIQNRFRRVRMGKGRYTMLPSGNAEITCEFPNTMLLISILRLTNPPVFEIDRLLINKANSHCALIGTKGIAIVKIPRRWGPDAMFEGGKKEITIRCTELDVRYFSCKSSKIVKQVRWHPASPKSTHLVVLTTEDTLRLYDVQQMVLVTVWHLSQAFSKSSTRLSSRGGTAIRTLSSLGETAIDFDFTPPVFVGNANSSKCDVEWPILILAGDGDIYVLTASLEDKKKVKFDGPLPFNPPSDDNYGMEDASSVIVLQCTPPIVVVATCTGKVYHSILLSNNEDSETIEVSNIFALTGLVGKGTKPGFFQEKSVELLESSRSYHFNSYFSNAALYVFECVELELGIALDENAELYSSPITLYADAYVSSRYFCLHEAGLHAVIMPIVLDLEQYAKCTEDEADLYLPSLRQSQSSIEYLICTQISGDEPSQLSSSPLIGFRVTELPCNLIALSLCGEFTILPLRSTALVPKSNTVITSTVSSEEDVQIENFRNHIENILRPENGISRPILKLDPSVSNASETYAEILTEEIDGLREDYFSRYQNAVAVIERRLKSLSSVKEKQSKDVIEMQQKCDEMNQKGKELKKLSSQVAEKQNTLETSAKEMLQKIRRKHPTSTVVRQNMEAKVKENYKKVQELSIKVDELRKKQQFQNKEMMETSTLSQKDLYLDDKHQNIIQESLKEIALNISDLKRKQQIILKEANEVLKKWEI